MIRLTEIAADKAKEILKDDGILETGHLRAMVRGGGCSGYRYELYIDDKELGEMDEVFESHGVRIAVNTTCMPYLDGTEIDYEEKLMGGGFKFNNPKSVTTCGCGESFGV